MNCKNITNCRLIEFGVEKINLFALVFFVFFCAITFYNARIQKVPNFNYKVLASGEWKITNNNHKSMKEGTVINALDINSEVYELDKQWLFPSFFSTRTHEQLLSSFAKENLLYEASSSSFSQADISNDLNSFIPIPNVKLIDETGKTHRVSLRNYEFTDVTLFTLLIYVLGWSKFIFSIVIAKVGELNRQKRLFLISSLIFGLMCFINPVAISRTWAINPQMFHSRMLVILFIYLLYWCSVVLIFFHSPINLFKRFIIARLIFYFILLYSLTSLGLYVFVDPKKFNTNLSISLYVAPLFSYFMILFQSLFARRQENTRLSINIALKWMLTFIVSLGLLNMVLNIGAQFGWLEGRYVNILMLVNNVFLLSIGISVLILHEYLYKIDTWWWQVWGVFSAISLGLVCSSLLAEASLEFSLLSFAFSVLFGSMGYLITVNYFRMKYARAESQLLELTIPFLLKINNKNNSLNSINVAWQEILCKVFNPNVIHLKPLDELAGMDLNCVNSILSLPSGAMNDMRSYLEKNVAFICNSGELLVVQAADNKVFMLSHPSKGLKLFSNGNVNKAKMLWEMIWQTYQASLAYQEGEVAERKRIAYDLHDDLGGKLLHLSSQEGEYGEYARKTLQDLRTLTHALSNEERTLALILADIRYVIREYCDQAEIELFFSSEIDEALVNEQVSSQASVNITCIFNELVRNALQSPSSKMLSISFVVNNDICILKIENDGFLTDPKIWKRGLGTVSAERRVNQLKGKIFWKKRPKGGVLVDAYWPTKEIS